MTTLEIYRAALPLLDRWTATYPAATSEGKKCSFVSPEAVYFSCPGNLLKVAWEAGPVHRTDEFVQELCYPIMLLIDEKYRKNTRYPFYEHVSVWNSSSSKELVCETFNKVLIGLEHAEK